MIRGATKGNGLPPSVAADQLADAVLDDRRFVLAHSEGTDAAAKARLHPMETVEPPAVPK